VRRSHSSGGMVRRGGAAGRGAAGVLRRGEGAVRRSHSSGGVVCRGGAAGRGAAGVVRRGGVWRGGAPGRRGGAEPGGEECECMRSGREAEAQAGSKGEVVGHSGDGEDAACMQQNGGSPGNFPSGICIARFVNKGSDLIINHYLGSHVTMPIAHVICMAVATWVWCLAAGCCSWMILGVECSWCPGIGVRGDATFPQLLEHGLPCATKGR
jgi:hypothetical protein